MAPKAAAGFCSLVRACARAAARHAWAWLAAGPLIVALASPGYCQADPLKGEATLTASGGYARLVLRFADYIDTQVNTAGSILVIQFKRPVDISIDRLAESAPDYVGSVRRDPDGTAIRLALSRKVTVNTMTAGERIFIDLLPDNWSGQPPGLPTEVVRELSERARAAERALRQQRAAADVKKRAPIRVRASVQPTFVRYLIETPEGTNVSSVLIDQKLTLSFNKQLVFDLADAKIAAPPSVASINQKIDGDSSAIEVALIGEVDVHAFRDEKNYIVDVAFQQTEKPKALPQMSDASHQPAATAPAEVVEKHETAAAPAEEPPAIAAPATTKPAPPQKHAEEHSPAQAPEIAPTEVEARAPEATPEEKPMLPAPSPKEPAMAEALQPPAPAAPVEVAPPKAAPATPEQPAEIAPAKGKAVDGAVAVETRRDSDGLRLAFSFPERTPAALFRRADTVWLVLDSQKPIDIESIRSNAGADVAEVGIMPLPKGQAIRIRLNRPKMPALSGSEQGGRTEWTLTFADAMQAPTQQLTTRRNIVDPALANVTVMLSKPGRLHRLVDPDAGDTLLVVTAPPPVRGFIKRQDFVDMALLESIHGIAVRPNSDDVTAELASDKVTLGKPGGLTLSPADIGSNRAAAARPIFDVEAWRKDQDERFIARADELLAVAASAEADQRTPARIDLARFYMSRGLYPEAKGVLDLALSESRPGQEDPMVLLAHSVASTLMGRPGLGLKDLANPAIGTSNDSQLWQALALSRQAKWADAREKFKNVEFAITSLPIDLQRIIISDAMRASIEVKDYAGAAKRSSDLEVIGLSPELAPGVAVLRGRLAEALGHDDAARKEYAAAVESPDRAAAAEAKLLDIMLQQRRDQISQADALREYETLSVMWRGDGIEVKALQLMSQIYADTGRYNEAMGAARAATKLQPNSEISRQLQDASAALFAQLYLSPKGDDLPPVDALAMFYEYHELTPIGRRGDEMIRRLADRLVAVDLLDQAAELLQYQVDHRLEGAARAQVASRLAMVYLMNRKPDRAIAALRTTRISDLSGELRQQRLLLEARAQSDVGRHDLALDIISNIAGREVIRLRSDIYWASRRWRESSEQIELYFADRWRDFKPLNALEKSDVLRAVIGYALAEDAIGLARFREKYAPLMSGEADRIAFETASTPANGSSAEFAQIAKLAATVDTLDGFLRDMKARFPDATARAALPPESAKDPASTGSLPAIVGLRPAGATR